MEFMLGRTWHHHVMNDSALRTRSSVLHRFWRDHISDKKKRPQRNIPPYARASLAARKATFSFAMTAMDKVAEWNEEKWVGSKFAASVWICTKAVLCDGRGRPPQDLRQMLRIFMESVSCG